jgi:Sulfotransferase domain
VGRLRNDLRRHAKKLRKKFTERQRWDFDVYLLSYPKCGRTWITLQIGRAISQHYGLEVPNLLKLSVFGEQIPEVPHIRLTHDDQPHRKRPYELSATREKLAGKKVILLVRDPRDVIVSYYHHKSRRERDRDFWWFQGKRKETHSRFAGTLAEFLDVEIGGFDTLLRYYNVWEQARHTPREFLLLRYEDMQADPAGQLRRVLDFLGLAAITDAEVKEAVEYASFRNMRKIEAGEEVKSFKLKAGDVNDPDSYKVRRGKVGGYRDDLTPAQIDKLERKMAAGLSAFYGYEPNTGK